MKTFNELSREERIERVNSQRREDLVLVLENLTEDLNISAILRSAEGFGLKTVYIVHPEGRKPKLSNGVSSGATKWLDIRFSTSIVEVLTELKKVGFTIYLTHVDPKSENIWKTNFAKKVAIVMGNEAQGVSSEAIEQADHLVYISMNGLTESFNVSVATAIFLYEIVRQKEYLKS